MSSFFPQFIPGFRLVDGSDLNQFVTCVGSTKSGIVAHAGGGRASATALGSAINQISTVATAADSVVLPPALAGNQMLVINNGAAAAQVFANGSDTIDGTAGATGISLAADGKAIFACYANGKWASFLSA